MIFCLFNLFSQQSFPIDKDAHPCLPQASRLCSHQTKQKMAQAFRLRQLQSSYNSCFITSLQPPAYQL